VPDEPTAGAARELAEFAEEAYARDRADAEGWTVHGVEYVHSAVADENASAGVYAYVEVSLDAAASADRADGTEATVLASLYYEGWYRVTASRVERAPAFGDGEPSDERSPPEDGWVTIACD